jgi:8-oxo-dGTP pyrophosphatase MutT (NUDIX family)
MLVRDGAAGVEVYLTRRSARSSFVPDAFVFPGGAVEAQDRSPAIAMRLNAPTEAPELTIAAVRELFEEAAILLACDEAGARCAPDARWVRAARERLRTGTPFVDILTEARLTVDARAVLPYSNWITPVEESKRFDTHFFAALAPAGQTAEADALEVHDGRWLAPADALERAQRGEMTIIFPTRKHLERIALHSSAQAFLDHAKLRRYAPLVAVSLGGNEFGLPEGTAEW